MPDIPELFTTAGVAGSLRSCDSGLGDCVRRGPAVSATEEFSSLAFTTPLAISAGGGLAARGGGVVPGSARGDAPRRAPGKCVGGDIAISSRLSREASTGSQAWWRKYPCNLAGSQNRRTTFWSACWKMRPVRQ